MKYLFLLNFLLSIPFFQAESKTSAKVIDQKNTNDQTKELTPKTDKPNIKKIIKSLIRSTRKVASKKSKKTSLEEVSKSTALVISGYGNSAQAGSGFFIDKNLFVTNSHVVEDALVKNNLKVVFIQKQQENMEIGFVFAEDKENDLAIIKTFRENHKFLKLGKYNKVKMGDDIFVLGSPQGLVGTLSKGIVSAKRNVDDYQILQITAPVSQGSSGSPVLSKDLKVIGIAVALSKQGQNINFAVPVTYLKKLIKSSKKNLATVSKLKLKEMLKDNKLILSIENKKPKKLKTNFEKGVYYLRERNYKKAVYWLKKSANQGDPKAQTALGSMYNLGLGVPQSYKKAFYWHKKAANQGNVDAQMALGSMYNLGQGVSKDSKKAFYWHKKAANQGNADAQMVLGSMYYEGQGVSKDSKKAFYWYKKSANQGYINAQKALGFMYYLGQGVSKNLIHAYLWLDLAISTGGVKGREAKDLKEYKDLVSKEMSPKQIAVAQKLSIKKAIEIAKKQQTLR